MRHAEDLLLAFLRGHCVEGCPPLLHVLASAVRANDPAFLIFRKGQDFRELLLAGPTEEIVLEHDFLPQEKHDGQKYYVLASCRSMALPIPQPPAWNFLLSRGIAKHRPASFGLESGPPVGDGHDLVIVNHQNGS